MPLLENEKELENHLMSYFGAYFDDWHTYRDNQVDLGPYGIADIVSIGISPAYGAKKNCQKIALCIRILELKKEKIDYCAIGQICRYRQAIGLALKNILNKTYQVKLACTLVGREVDTNSDLVFLVQSLKWLEIYTYDITLASGLELKNVVSGDSNFIATPNGVDNDKYAIPIIKKLLNNKESRGLLKYSIKERNKELKFLNIKKTEPLNVIDLEELI